MSRRMVIPGELVAEGEYKLGDGVYREGDSVYSALLGLLDEARGHIRVIPFTGKYTPKVGDFVIGKVEDSQFSFWRVDINSAYSGILNASDHPRDVDPHETSLHTILAPGELVYAMVREVSPSKKVFITLEERGARVLKKGRIIGIIPAKIPRVIGKKGSMLSVLNETGCKILVGQNGRIWADGQPARVDLLERAIKQIGEEAHKGGLTDTIRNMIIEEREML